MASYLNTDTFLATTLVPRGVLDEIEVDTPGWLAQQIAIASAMVDARMSKRYATPFTAPYPLAVTQWVNAIVSMNAWLKRGISATDESFLEYKAQVERAFLEMKEAADSEMGLFDLPMVVDNVTTSAIKHGFPRVYSEQSPYVAFEKQAKQGRREDDFGGGTSQ